MDEKQLKFIKDREEHVAALRKEFRVQFCQARYGNSEFRGDFLSEVTPQMVEDFFLLKMGLLNK